MRRGRETMDGAARRSRSFVLCAAARERQCEGEALSGLYGELSGAGILRVAQNDSSYLVVDVTGALAEPKG